MSDDTIDPRFHEFARSGDAELRNELIVDNQGLAFAFARRYRDRGVGSDDLDQIALEGLVRAVDGFDPDRGIRFSTYAARRIEGSLKQYFRDRTWSVHVPRSAKELANTVQTAIAELTQTLARSPTPAEIADHVGVDIDDVTLALEASSAYRAGPIEGATGLGTLDPGGEIDRVEAAETAPRLLEALSEDDRRVVELRFYENLTQSEISERVGVSQMQVSRVLRRALDRLRVAAENDEPS